ncbi:hypothetical protein K503DRAFT_850105 [Rhizopogon vinicolor AM-OR11-026]|uniref:CHAT domain-containing protein n=1 Tax=Rhizopogon vinicolor AM-OR11-026 TaxID=1314800 RepID=A0A1B7N032_9AGAM|nr:hypothetical protein K503DRAFT_850105 [Rhizopogon vinicolor AM-OR11-026]
MTDDVEQHRAALQECPLGHPGRYIALNNLANSLHGRFEQQGILSYLNESIEHRRDALALHPPGHSLRLLSLHNLAISLEYRFDGLGVLSDLDELIELHRDALTLQHGDVAALALRPPGHYDRSSSLNNLATSLTDRFQQQGLHRAALPLRPPGHYDRSILQDRFEQLGAMPDLVEAIEHHQAALMLRAAGHHHRHKSLNKKFIQQGAIELYQAALMLCPSGHPNHAIFEQQGSPPDLDDAIKLHRTALELRAPGHCDRPSSLNNLAASLTVGFMQLGILSNLDESIELYRAALVLCPPGHNLANSLQRRFEQRAALVLRPSGHSDRSTSLNSLANMLTMRFRHLGILSALDEAIELHRAALALCPDGHSNQPMCLNSLSISLQSRFKKLDIQSDLDESIELLRASLALCPPGHFHRVLSLDCLAQSLRDRFQQLGVTSDLDESIELNRAALDLCHPDHHYRASFLNDLSRGLIARFQHRGILPDLEESIGLCRAALALFPPGHSYQSASLSDLAMNLQVRFQQQGLLSSDLDEAFGLFSELSTVSHAISHDDLRAAKLWVASAEKVNHASALVAYQTTLRFLDFHVAVLSPSSHHLDVVRLATASLAMDAFSCSIRRGALTTAVELVEQGRAVFWTQLARFRTPLDDLSVSGDTGRSLAEEFEQLSFRFRNMFDASTGDRSPQIRQLTMQWDDVISRIRALPGFSRFLLPPMFSDLQKAAEAGPVIIVNVSQHSCDALIILSAQDPVHIPLDIARTEVSELSSEFQSLTERGGSSHDQLELQNIVGVLRKLWDRIVGPIVQALREIIQPGSRIWWCPTAEFTLLPLHAAGPYEKKSNNLSHFYISSYTPTLAALIHARQQSQDASVQHFVAIGQANPDRGKELQCVAPELKVVSQRVAPVVSFTSFEDSDATIQGAFDALSRNQWLHLACHGMPNRKQPFESSFAMHDGPLTIKDIIRSRLQNPEFAFLSACHTTVGDESSHDEAIHLAAAMQFAGFRSVIGSMWSVDDGVAHQIVSAFYDNLVDGSGRLDCTLAAVALHKALKTCRKKIPFEQQIVFIHIGA